jgi:hypothetical protein
MVADPWKLLLKAHVALAMTELEMEGAPAKVSEALDIINDALQAHDKHIQDADTSESFKQFWTPRGNYVELDRNGYRLRVQHASNGNAFTWCVYPFPYEPAHAGGIAVTLEAAKEAALRAVGVELS